MTSKKTHKVLPDLLFLLDDDEIIEHIGDHLEMRLVGRDRKLINEAFLAWYPNERYFNILYRKSMTYGEFVTIHMFR